MAYVQTLIILVSSELRVCELENDPFVDDLPIKMVIFYSKLLVTKGHAVEYSHCG